MTRPDWPKLHAAAEAVREQRLDVAASRAREAVRHGRDLEALGEELLESGSCRNDIRLVEMAIAVDMARLDGATGPGRVRAMTSLGKAFAEHGRRTGDVRTMGLAHSALRQAVSETDAEGRTRAWSALGVFLLGVAADARSEVAAREALAIFDDVVLATAGEPDPTDWCWALSNRGAVCKTLGEVTGDEEFVWDAVDAYELALTRWTRASHPGEWAVVQNNLASTLSTLSGMAGRTDLEERTMAAYGDALTVWTEESRPDDWAMVVTNLGIIHQSRGKPADLRVACDLYRAARRRRTIDGSLTKWCVITKNLSRCLLDIARVERDAAIAAEAVRCLSELLLALPTDHDAEVLGSIVDALREARSLAGSTDAAARVAISLASDDEPTFPSLGRLFGRRRPRIVTISRAGISDGGGKAGIDAWGECLDVKLQTSVGVVTTRRIVLTFREDGRDVKRSFVVREADDPELIARLIGRLMELARA